MLDFDDMLEELGELGKFQIYTYILVCLPVLFGAANSLSYVFTAGVPNYRYEGNYLNTIHNSGRLGINMNYFKHFYDWHVSLLRSSSKFEKKRHRFQSQFFFNI